MTKLKSVVRWPERCADILVNCSGWPRWKFAVSGFVLGILVGGANFLLLPDFAYYLLIAGVYVAGCVLEVCFRWLHNLELLEILILICQYTIFDYMPFTLIPLTYHAVF